MHRTEADWPTVVSFCSKPTGASEAGWPSTGASYQLCPAQNCFSVTPADIMPVDDMPPETMFPISSTISEPLHF